MVSGFRVLVAASIEVCDCRFVYELKLQDQKVK